MNWKGFCLGASLTLLAGCVSSGTMVTEKQASGFQRGVTTREQVITAVGAPNQTVLRNDGSRIDVYVHIQASANAASFIPLAGLLFGGAHSTSNTVTLTYDKGGVLQTIDETGGHGEVSTGLLNQH